MAVFLGGTWGDGWVLGIEARAAVHINNTLINMHDLHNKLAGSLNLFLPNTFGDIWELLK